jgi:Fic family protein
MMNLLPTTLNGLDERPLKEIDETVKAIYRLIVFNRRHKESDLLKRYLEAMQHLRDVMSIKNAQQEAQTDEEAKEYLANLQKSVGLIVDEIAAQHTLESPVDLFRLFRLIAPEASARHPNRFRSTTVQFGPCLGAKPGEIAGLVEQLFENLKEIQHPITRAVYMHHELVRIHPFVDGNGRLSRMAKNWMLMYDLYPPMFIKNISDKERYIRRLQDSFLSIDREAEVLHVPTLSFFQDEFRRLRASATFILHRMLKNPELEFPGESEDLMGA